MVESIVEWFGLRAGSNCGYCKSEKTKINYGMWAHRLSCAVYQQLLDRGWRRSGMYCYKPVMQRTCCPQYTIRCDATQVKLSKSQKKVLKRMNNFLVSGFRTGGGGSNEAECDDNGFQDEGGEAVPTMTGDLNTDYNNSAKAKGANTSAVNHGSIDHTSIKSKSKIVEADGVGLVTAGRDVSCTKEICESYSPTVQERVTGPDPHKPKCRKAKDLRRENRLLKLNNSSGVTSLVAPSLKMEKKAKNAEKSIDDYFAEQNMSERSHILTLTLVNVQDKSSLEPTFKEEFMLYRKYQTTIHKDVESDITERRFQRFLIDGPLKYLPTIKKSDRVPSVGFGAFHQQYRLDGKLIAVGVIDILPDCVSSKYFFYDPDYRFLSIGTYSAIQEIYLVRSLNQSCPTLKNYYMGFYIESCPKMKYKGKYRPSYLLCPETYTWKTIESCVCKFSGSKYARLEDDGIEGPASPDVSAALILNENEVLTYDRYLEKVDPSTRIDQINEIKAYSELVGQCCHEILLYRS